MHQQPLAERVANFLTDHGMPTWLAVDSDLGLVCNIIGWVGMEELLEHQNIKDKQKFVALLLKLCDWAMSEKDYTFALDLLKYKLKDEQRIRKFACQALADRYYASALHAYDFIQDRQGILKVMDADPSMTENCAKNYLGKELEQALYRGFGEWIRGKDLRLKAKPPTWHPGLLVCSVYDLSLQYDHAVGISKGGLFPSFLFSAFGMDASVIDAHKDTRVSRWINGPPILQDRKVLVVDKDVVSGVTCRKVARKIKGLEPAAIGLYLVWGEAGLMCSNLDNVPPIYGQVHCATDGGYALLEPAVAALESRLKTGLIH